MPIRETFWNIPHWAEIGQYLLGALTIVIFSLGIYRRVHRWRKGQPEPRTDRFGFRLWTTLVQSIGQVRTAREVYPGIMHLAIFWGMAALTLGTILATVDWDVTHLFFGFQFLEDGVYIVYELILDLLGLVLIIGLAMAAYRRYVLRPERLENMPERNLGRDDAYAIVMLLLVAISGYLVEGLRIAVVQPDWAAWSPVGNLLAGWFYSMGDPTNRSLHLAIWVTHTLVAFTFIASIPFTKLSHIVTLPTNIFFRSLQPAGALAPARYHSNPGVGAWEHFTWKQILDFEACIRCGRCLENCPSHASGVEMSPRDLMIKLDRGIWHKGNGKALIGDWVRSEDLWACTTCRACSQVCPAFIDHTSTVVDMRRYLVDQGDMDLQLQEALMNLGRYGNSFGQSERARARWTQPVQPKIQDARKAPVDYLWFVGDYASYHTSLAEITRQTASVFQAAGMDFGILYEVERNSGNDVRRVGEEGMFEMLVEKNNAILERCEFKALITTDPHTYNTLRNEYPGNGNGNHAVLHSAQVLDEKIANGQLKLKRRLDYVVTYHDPCYLGRYNDIYAAPRRIIAATGCRLVEMPCHGDLALCCGAGGGRIWMDEGPIKDRPSEVRVREAASLPGVNILVVACPKDVVMFAEAIKATNLEDRIQVRDLNELVYEALVE